MKKVAYLLIVFSVIVLFISILEVNYDKKHDSINHFNENKDTEVSSTSSGTIDLRPHWVFSYGEWVKQGDVLSYSFHTDPSLKIDVWIMDNGQYNTFVETNQPTGLYIFTCSNGSGIHFPQYESKWQVVFLNEENEETTLHYNISFSPAIVITYPKSSTEVAPGSQLKIEWESNIDGEAFAIDIYKGTSFLTTIQSYTLNDGIEYWQIPESYTNGKDYKIKITALTSGEKDYSPEFSIRKELINVFNPSIGKKLIPHTTHAIDWVYSKDVRLDLYLNSTWVREIRDDISSDDTYYWKVWQGSTHSNTTYHYYRVRVQDLTDSNIYGYSPYFTITNEKFMNILTPKRGSSYNTGDIVNISWKTDIHCSNVHIKLKVGGEIKCNIITTSNDGEYLWKIPSNISSGSRYTISIKAEDGSAKAESRTFKISQEAIPSFEVHLLLFTITIVSICLIVIQKLKYRTLP